MNVNHLKFGYWPYRAGYDTPGDRRRFVFYARAKKINFELATDDKKFDIVYLTMGCDIHKWLNYKKKNPNTKIIFESIDSYFLEGFNVFSFFRGIIKFITGKESRLFWNYNNALTSMFKAADAVVCSTQIQKDFISKYNPNVHISLDYFAEDITHTKINYSIDKKLKLVWEGQAYTVHNLLKLKNVFERLSHKIELHIITDPALVYPFKIFNKKTSAILDMLPCEKYFHPWEKDSFSEIISQADLAIVPIDKNDKLHWNKPENKLLLLWQIGIPVLTTDTPAYTKVMNNAGLPMLCSTVEDWIQKIESFMAMDETDIISNVSKAFGYLQNNHTKEIILHKWDLIFSSVFILPITSKATSTQ